MNRKMLLIAALLASAAAVAAQDDKPLVAVNDFGEQGVSRTEANVISERFRAELQKTGAVRQIERGQMEAILKEQGFQQSGCTSDACAVEVGQILGVRKIVVGSVGVAGSYTVLSARVLDVATGEVLVTEEYQTRGGVDDLMVKGVRDLAGRLSGALAGRTVPSTAAARDSSGTAAAQSSTQGADSSGVATVEPQKRKRRAGPVIAIIGVAVAGGITAAIILATRSDEPAENNSTVRITLE